MMELKFRVWDIKGNQFWDNSVGDWKIEIVEGGEMEVYIYDYDNEYFYPLEDVVIQQYTGLKDSNGKEIYEGDILSVDYGDRIENHAVIWGKWDDGEYLFNCECWMVDGIPLSDIHNKTWGHAKADVTVIGNIYENPELLK